MNCPYCGRETVYGDSFCQNCGKSLITNPQNYQENNKNTAFIVILVVLVAIVSALSVLVWNLYKENQNTKQQVVYNIVEPPNAALPAETPNTNAKTETQKSYSKADGYYSPAFTYKGMPEIYESVISRQSVFDWVNDAIFSFDLDCQAYMNGEATVPYRLLEGSHAYQQQTDYKQRHPNLTQTYDLINVMNVRENGNSYFAWVNEKITQTENGTVKTEDDYWVYKLVDKNGTLYIVDYIYDPAHK